MGATSSVCTSSVYTEESQSQPVNEKHDVQIKESSDLPKKPPTPQPSPGAARRRKNALRRRLSRVARGVAWASAPSRIQAMDSQLVTLRCSDGEIVTTPDTIAKIPLMGGPNACAHSEKELVQIVLDTVRRGGKLLVAEDFCRWREICNEFKRFGLTKLANEASPHTITLSCQAALSTGRLNPEITFRKVVRIVVCGRVAICRDVFEEQLNEARDGDASMDKYTSRFYLKHSQLERAFDTLSNKGFRMMGASTFAPSHVPQHTTDETTFLHHTQYIFTREPGKSVIYQSAGA